MAPVRGLKFTKDLTARMVTSLDLRVDPSIGIMARKVDKLGLDIRSMREPLRRSIKHVMGPSIKKNFDVGGRPEPWAPLEEDTKRNKRGQGSRFVNDPLIRTRRLRNVAGQLNIWTFSRDAAFIADLPGRVWYGKVHQAGATFPYIVKIPVPTAAMGEDRYLEEEGFIPQRRFLIIQEEDEAAIERVFGEWLDEKIARSGI